MKVSKHEMLSFSVRKEIIKNDKSLVVILLSKVAENEFLQTHKVESSYCHYLDMLKLQTNERNDVYIFPPVVTHESLPASLQSFKTIEEAIEPLREIAWSIYGI